MSSPMPEPLEPEIDRLLDAERSGSPVPAGAADRVLARVATTLGFPPPAGAGPGPTHHPGSAAAPHPGARAVHTGIKALAAKPLVAGALGFVLGGATGAGVVSALETSRAPAPTVRAPRSVAVAAVERPSALTAPSGAPVASAPSTAPAVSAPAPAAKHARADAGDRSKRDARLSEERALIAQAQAAIARGRGDQALAALAQHAREFPHGQLTEEREALIVQALVAAGRRQQAKSRARQFERRFPKSYLLPVVRAAVH